MPGPNAPWPPCSKQLRVFRKLDTLQAYLQEIGVVQRVQGKPVRRWVDIRIEERHHQPLARVVNEDAGLR